MWDNNKQYCIILESQKGEKVRQNKHVKNGQNFSKFVENHKITHVRTYQTPSIRHFFLSHTKSHHNQIAEISDNKQIFKATRKRSIRYRATKIQKIADFSSEITQSRTQRRDTFKVLKENKSANPEFLTQNNFLNWREIKTFQKKFRKIHCHHTCTKNESKSNKQPYDKPTFWETDPPINSHVGDPS